MTDEPQPQDRHELDEAVRRVWEAYAQERFPRPALLAYYRVLEQAIRDGRPFRKLPGIR